MRVESIPTTTMATTTTTTTTTTTASSSSSSSSPPLMTRHTSLSSITSLTLNTCCSTSFSNTAVDVVATQIEQGKEDVMTRDWNKTEDEEEDNPSTTTTTTTTPRRSSSSSRRKGMGLPKEKDDDDNYDTEEDELQQAPVLPFRGMTGTSSSLLSSSPSSSMPLSPWMLRHQQEQQPSSSQPFTKTTRTMLQTPVSQRRVIPLPFLASLDSVSEGSDDDHHDHDNDNPPDDKDGENKDCKNDSKRPSLRNVQGFAVTASSSCSTSIPCLSSPIQSCSSNRGVVRQRLSSPPSSWNNEQEEDGSDDPCRQQRHHHHQDDCPRRRSKLPRRHPLTTSITLAPKLSKPFFPTSLSNVLQLQHKQQQEQEQQHSSLSLLSDPHETLHVPSMMFSAEEDRCWWAPPSAANVPFTATLFSSSSSPPVPPPLPLAPDVATSCPVMDPESYTTPPTTPPLTSRDSSLRLSPPPLGGNVIDTTEPSSSAAGVPHDSSRSRRRRPSVGLHNRHESTATTMEVTKTSPTSANNNNNISNNHVAARPTKMTTTKTKIPAMVRRRPLTVPQGPKFLLDAKYGPTTRQPQPKRQTNGPKAAVAASTMAVTTPPSAPSRRRGTGSSSSTSAGRLGPPRPTATQKVLDRPGDKKNAGDKKSPKTDPRTHTPPSSRPRRRPLTIPVAPKFLLDAKYGSDTKKMRRPTSSSSSSSSLSPPSHGTGVDEMNRKNNTTKKTTSTSNYPGKKRSPPFLVDPHGRRRVPNLGNHNSRIPQPSPSKVFLHVHDAAKSVKSLPTTTATTTVRRPLTIPKAPKFLLDAKYGSDLQGHNPLGQSSFREQLQPYNSEDDDDSMASVHRGIREKDDDDEEDDDNDHNIMSFSPHRSPSISPPRITTATHGPCSRLVQPRSLTMPTVASKRLLDAKHGHESSKLQQQQQQEQSLVREEVEDPYCNDDDGDDDDSVTTVRHGLARLRYSSPLGETREEPNHGEEDDDNDSVTTIPRRCNHEDDMASSPPSWLSSSPPRLVSRNQHEQQQLLLQPQHPLSIPLAPRLCLDTKYGNNASSNTHPPHQSGLFSSFSVPQHPHDHDTNHSNIAPMLSPHSSSMSASAAQDLPRSQGRRPLTVPVAPKFLLDVKYGATPVHKSDSRSSSDRVSSFLHSNHPGDFDSQFHHPRIGRAEPGRGLGKENDVYADDDTVTTATNSISCYTTSSGQLSLSSASTSAFSSISSSSFSAFRSTVPHSSTVVPQSQVHATNEDW